VPCKKRPTPTPGCQGPGTTGACNVCRNMTLASRDEVGGLFALKSAAVKTKTYTRHVAEVVDNKQPSWRTQYTLSTTASSSVLTVKVAIQVSDGTGSATQMVKARWGSMIGTVWNNKASVSVPVYPSAISNLVASTVTRTVVFELDFVGAGGGSPYPVTCSHTRSAKEYMDYFDALAPNQRDFLINQWRAQQPLLQAYSTADPEWKKLNYLSNVTRDHTRHGTPHLQIWGDNDSEAVQHEFGHAIGLPDEYTTTQYWTSADGNTWTEIVLDLSIHNLAPFTTKSLMNNTMSNQGSRVFPRHYKMLAGDFEDFVSTTLGVTGVVKPNTARVAMLS
jgi:hypothetical protein